MVNLVCKMAQVLSQMMEFSENLAGLSQFLKKVLKISNYRLPL